MQERTIYNRLKEAAAMANMIEAAESFFVSIDSDSIRELDRTLLRTLDEIREAQSVKISEAQRGK